MIEYSSVNYIMQLGIMKLWLFRLNVSGFDIVYRMLKNDISVIVEFRNFSVKVSVVLVKVCRLLVICWLGLLVLCVCLRWQNVCLLSQLLRKLLVIYVCQCICNIIEQYSCMIELMISSVVIYEKCSSCVQNLLQFFCLSVLQKSWF